MVLESHSQCAVRRLMRRRRPIVSWSAGEALASAFSWNVIASIGVEPTRSPLASLANVVLFGDSEDRCAMNSRATDVMISSKAELPGKSWRPPGIAGEVVHEAEPQDRPNEADDMNARAEVKSD